MTRPRILLVPNFTELEWLVKPRLEEWAEVASYDPPGVGEGNGTAALIAADRAEAVQGIALGHACVNFEMTGERPRPRRRDTCSEMTQEERIAHNEAFHRDLNERKAEWLRVGLQAAGFRCECWRIDCGVRIQLSEEEWQEVRSRANRFAVAPGHAATDLEPDVEQVVKQYPHFWIIEKRGEAGDLAAELE